MNPEEQSPTLPDQATDSMDLATPPAHEVSDPSVEAISPDDPTSIEPAIADPAPLKETIEVLQQQQQALLTEIPQLQASIAKMITDGAKELEQRRSELELEIEKLERRKERINQEMRTSFAGVSQDLAIRVQGFKDYLVGSLQDLAVAAEQLDIPDYQTTRAPAAVPQPGQGKRGDGAAVQPQFSQQGFQDEVQQIRKLLEQYRQSPDYYGPPWQLRRTFEPIHAERVQEWFFTQAGRGAIKSMGSPLQNVLISSAIISVLHTIYGQKLRTLVLASSPERLGEWRRGLQDCLGIFRSDFGPEKGVSLFEGPDALIQKAERLRDQKLLPLVILDDSAQDINLGLMQFPLWLAFAPEFEQNSGYFF
ncbi:MAG: DUF3086 domain-containing protein [Synechococcaceae cyanobacterium RL_1_2]|nr:DUF3086 domain-containing protein [Synechococcaceae cyanobacterium RL_1_2]